MARIFFMGLLLWMGLISPSLAGYISDIKVGKETANEIEIIIEGEYAPYRAFGLTSPARFVIDLQGGQLKKGIPPARKISGGIISGIRAGQMDNRLRLVFDSSDPGKPFHCNIQDQKGKLLVKCWRPEEAKTKPGLAIKSASGASSSPLLPKKELGELFGWTKKVEDTKKKDKTNKFARYTGNKITVSFYKEDIHNVFSIFATPGLIDKDINIMVDDKVEGEVTLALNEVPWDLVLDIVLDENALVMEEKAAGIFFIKSRPKGSFDRGELVVRKFSEEILQPAKQQRKEKKDLLRSRSVTLMAHNLESEGKLKEALALYEEAYGLWKDNMDLVKKVAYLQYILDNFAKSYFYAGEAMKLNPKDAEAAMYAALSLARMDRQAEARLLFEIAIKARPKIPEVFYNYGLFLERQEDYGTALYIYQRYARLFGPFLKVSLGIARLYEGQGKAKEACDKYKEIQCSGFKIDKKTENIIQKRITTLCSQGEN